MTWFSSTTGPQGSGHRGHYITIPQTSCTSWEIRQNIMKFPYICASSYIENPPKNLINLYKPGNFMPRHRRFHPHRSRAGNPYLAICHVWVVLRDTSARHLEVAEGRWVVTSKMVVSQWNPTFWVTFFFQLEGSKWNQIWFPGCLNFGDFFLADGAPLFQKVIDEGDHLIIGLDR